MLNLSLFWKKGVLSHQDEFLCLSPLTTFLVGDGMLVSRGNLSSFIQSWLEQRMEGEEEDDDVNFRHSNRE